MNTFSSRKSYRDEAARSMSQLVLCTEPDLGFYKHWAVELFVGEIWSRSPALGALDLWQRPMQALDGLTDRLSQIKIDNPHTGPSVSTYSTHTATSASAAASGARSGARRVRTPPPRLRTLDALCSLKSADDEANRKLFAIEYKAADILTPYLLELGLHKLNLEAVIHRKSFSTVAG